VLSDAGKPSGLTRARRTAATARVSMSAAGLILGLIWTPAHTSAILVTIGFTIMLVTALVQLLLPRTEWIQVEESLASVSAVLIIGLGPASVTTLTLLWLAAVASGVLARGGRAHWIGRALLLTSLALPIVHHRSVNANYVCLYLAAVALLLTCGRVTRELRKMLDQARWDADHDGLTAALSRTAFRDQLNRIAGAAQADDSAALLLVDLDNFGQINKTSGHAAGDRLLCSVVEEMRARFGADAVVGRLGGDEFAAIARTADAETAGRELLVELDTARQGRPAVQASMGIALIPRDGTDAEALLRAGDVALRVAKRSGRRQLSVYAGESFSDNGPGGARETLERLIEGEGLNVVVQPIVSLQDGRAHAYEALARFQTRGTSSPLHWFALADEFGVRDRLELACLRAALGYLHRRPEGTSLTVNLSGPLLLDERTAKLLHETGDISGLILELTENSLLEDTPGLHAEISRLLALGARFAVDDMGAGYSGLRQITTVRPSYLKLDRSLISGIDSDPDRGALVSAMLGYARQTGGHLVAEGVETIEELDTLIALGVELVQGYYLSRPGEPWPDIRSIATPRPAGRALPLTSPSQA
jgi:diguanylate cyclase (GGDEF)-like protein